MSPGDIGNITFAKINPVAVIYVFNFQHFSIYEQLEFHVQLCEHEKRFVT